MKLNTFARTERFVPKSLGNDQAPTTDQFYFDIDTVSVEDFFTLNAVMLEARAASDKANDLPEKSAERALANQKAAHAVVRGFAPIGVKYVRVHNLKDQTDKDVTIEDMVKYPLFGEVIMEVMRHMLGISSPNEESSGN